MSESNLCSNCVYRAESLTRYRMHIDEGKSGLMCNPAPKAECNWHTLAGESVNYEKRSCPDYMEIVL